MCIFRSSRIRRISLAAVAITCVLNLACRGRDGQHSSPAPGASATSIAEGAFRIVATDSGFMASATMAAGMRHISFENRSTQIHEAMLVKLPPGMTGSSYLQAIHAGELFPKGALDYSGPGLTSPGESTELWLKVDPGRYILMCFNDHPRPERVHEFTVQAPVIDDPAPKEDVVLKLTDYHFQLVGELRSGLRVIRIETRGPSMHEADLFRLPEGATVTDLNRWYREGSGGAPARALGGALDSHDISRIVWVRRRFDPGHYALHCAMPVKVGATGGTHITHADLGMVRAIDISE